MGEKKKDIISIVDHTGHSHTGHTHTRHSPVSTINRLLKSSTKIINAVSFAVPGHLTSGLFLASRGVVRPRREYLKGVDLFCSNIAVLTRLILPILR